MEDYFSNDVETAARLARDDAYDDDRPDPSDYQDEPEVLVCGEVGHGYYDSDKGCPDCTTPSPERRRAELSCPVTIADFTVPTGTDDDLPF